MKIILYTDGSVFPNPGPGGWAAILLAEKDGKVVSKEICGSIQDNTTNNRMELYGIRAGLQSIKKPEDAEVIVISDSNWAVNALGNPAWNIKKNLDLVDQIRQLVKIFFIKGVEFRWVKGHNGNQFNERCDVLAGLARKNKVVEQSQYVEVPPSSLDID